MAHEAQLLLALLSSSLLLPLFLAAWAIREACLLAISRGRQHAIVESDYKQLIDPCSSDLQPPWEIDTLVVDIRSLSASVNLSLFYS